MRMPVDSMQARRGLLARLGLTALLAAIAWIPALATAALPNCTSAALIALDVAGVAITSASDVAAKAPTPEYCAVVGTVATHGEGAAAGSAIFTLQLPANWNSKFLFFGCGGNCGSALFSSVSASSDDVAESLGLGYATVNTDTGHEQDPTTPDPTWILLSPGVPNQPAVIDYQYRAVHEVAVAAKQLVRGYFSSHIDYAYFDGCSTGGRQAMVEADRYPDDFDGLIAGDPVSDHANLDIADIKNAKSFLAPTSWIPLTLIPTIDAAVLAECDALDGVADGLIQNPGRCSFDLQSLVPSVLTQSQATAMKTYLGQVHDERGHPIFPGMPIGDMTTATFENVADFNAVAPSPTAAEPWGGIGKGPTAWTLGDSAIRYYVEYNPTFDVNNDWPETNGVIAQSALELMHEHFGIGDASQPERMDEFLHKGKKIIFYHGFADHLVSPWSTVWFYQALAERHGGYDRLQKQARLFMVPGMGHCSGGSGPNTFDTLDALDSWVTKGTAPDSITALNKASNRSMPLCPFPGEASFNGGDMTQAANWTCHAADQRLFEYGSDGDLAGARGGPPCAACKFNPASGGDDEGSGGDDGEHDGHGDH
jgi:feruloyl esterase